MPPSSQSGQSSRQSVPVGEFELYPDPEEGSFGIANRGGASLKSAFQRALVGEGDRQWRADDQEVENITSILDHVQKTIPAGASTVTSEDIADRLNVDDVPPFADLIDPFIGAASKIRDVLRLTALKVFADPSSESTAEGRRKPRSVAHNSGGAELVLHFARYGIHLIGTSTNVADEYRQVSEEWFENDCGYPNSVGADSWEEEEHKSSPEWPLKAAVCATERFLLSEWTLSEARQLRGHMKILREQATFIKSIVEYSIQRQLLVLEADEKASPVAGSSAKTPKTESESEERIDAFRQIRASAEKLETIIDTEFLAKGAKEEEKWKESLREQRAWGERLCAHSSEDLEQLFRLGYKGLEHALHHALQHSDAPATLTSSSRYLPLMFPLENESEKAGTARLAALRYCFEKEQQKLDADTGVDVDSTKGRGKGKHPGSESNSGEHPPEAEDEPVRDAGIDVSYLSHFIPAGQVRPLKAVSERKNLVPAMVDELAYDRVRAFQRGSRLYSASENLRRSLESLEKTDYDWLDGVELDSLVDELEIKHAHFIPKEIDFSEIQRPENYDKAIRQYMDLQRPFPLRTTNARRGVFLEVADPDSTSTSSPEGSSEPADLDLASVNADLDNLSMRS